MLRWTWMMLAVGCAVPPTSHVSGTWEGEGRSRPSDPFQPMQLQVLAVDDETITLTSEALGIEGAVLTYVAPEDWAWGVATHGFISVERPDPVEVEEGEQAPQHVPELRFTLYDDPACAYGSLAVGDRGGFVGQRVGGDRPRYCEVPDLSISAGDASGAAEDPTDPPEDTDRGDTDLD